MLNWIVWNGTVFDFETVLTLNWIVIYNCLNSLKLAGIVEYTDCISTEG